MQTTSTAKVTIVNGAVVTPDGIRIQNVEVENGVIAGLGLASNDGVSVDAAGCYVVPGLIDCHIHGLRGKGATDEDPELLASIASDLLANGITSFYPTGSATFKENNMNVLNNANTLQASKRLGARILGVHLEGPFLNEKKRGAQPARFIVPISTALLEEFIAAGRGLLSHVTLAPELDGALEAIAFLRGKGILVSAGHTNATYEEMEQGINAGIELMNHFYNGMRSLHHREVGALGAGFLDDRVSCELICDGVHVEPQAIKLAIRNKGFDKICMISDNTPVSGLPEGEYELPGKTVRVTKDGNFDHLGSLSGSKKTLFEDFVFMVNELGYPIEQVVQMASLNPARLHRVDDRKGSIAVGKDADVVILTKELAIKHIIQGTTVLTPDRNAQAI